MEQGYLCFSLAYYFRRYHYNYWQGLDLIAANHNKAYQ
jgi:hypothetical protein